jgi:hypothetical protein
MRLKTRMVNYQEIIPNSLSILTMERANLPNNSMEITYQCECPLSV